MPDNLAIALAIAAGAGVLIGLERQWDAQASGGGGPGQMAGVRTFTLWAVLGALSAYLQDRHAPGMFVAAFLALAAVAAGMAFLPGAPSETNRPFGITSLSASLLLFLAGGLAWWGPRIVAVALAVAMAILLFNKPWLHSFGGRITAEDWAAALKFAALTALVLPLLPDKGFGPFGAFNPRSIWLMVILVSGIGFAGYLASRIAGDRAGLVMTGLIGGLVSSTAATIAFSRRSKSDPGCERDCAIGIALACTVMLGRTAALLGALCPPLLLGAWPGLAVMAVPGAAALGWALLRPRAPGPPAVGHRPANPLGLGLAIKFALLFALIVFASRAAAHHYGAAGVPWVAFFSGLTDMDAIAISMAQLASGGGLDGLTAARCVWIAACANTGLKWLFALGGGSRALRLPVSLFMGGTLAAGLAALLLFNH